VDYLGIDGDVDKSGVALWNGKEFEFIGNKSFWELIDYIAELSSRCELKIILEAGFLNKKSNFHWVKSRAAAEKISKNVGQNEMIAKLVNEYCILNDIAIELVRPAKRKWDAATFMLLTGQRQGYNQDARDAARLVFGRCSS